MSSSLPLVSPMKYITNYRCSCGITKLSAKAKKHLKHPLLQVNTGAMSQVGPSWLLLRLDSFSGRTHVPNLNKWAPRIPPLWIFHEAHEDGDTAKMSASKEVNNLKWSNNCKTTVLISRSLPADGDDFHKCPALRRSFS